VECLGGLARYLGRLSVEVGNTRIYFNRVPRKLSRIVVRLSGRGPRPDLAVVGGGRVVVVDAKYRELDSRLALRDALRLAGYLADVARSRVLRAVVVSLRSGGGAVEAEIDGKRAVVGFAEANPDGEFSCENLLRHF